MKVSGIALALIDVPPEHAAGFNEWYDLDHTPEHVSKADVLASRRYTATPQLQAEPGTESSELTGGHPPFATVYFFGGPVGFDSEEALEGWRDKDRDIVRGGRFWRFATPVFTSRWRLADARARPAIDIDADAVPHLPHDGIVISIGRARSADEVEEAARWWDRTQAGALFEDPDLLAVLRFTPAEPENEGLLLHVLLCRTSPAGVLRTLREARARHRLTGRWPAFKDEYRQIALLPYEWIVPLRFDTDMSSPAP